MTTTWLNDAFTLFLLVAVPLLSYHTARSIQVLVIPRIPFYISAVISQWAVSLLCLLVLSITSLGWTQIGFREIPVPQFIRWTLWMTIATLAMMAVLLPVEGGVQWPAPCGNLTRWLLPETLREKLYAGLLVAPTAGFCEEFLYRGYLLTRLSQRLPSAGPWAVIISSLAFGAAHCYQGLTGMAATAALGALLAYPVRRLGTLYPSIVAHTLADALGMIWIIPLLLPLVERWKLNRKSRKCSCG